MMVGVYLDYFSDLGQVEYFLGRLVGCAGSQESAFLWKGSTSQVPVNVGGMTLPKASH